MTNKSLTLHLLCEVLIIIRLAVEKFNLVCSQMLLLCVMLSECQYSLQPHIWEECCGGELEGLTRASIKHYQS